MEQPHHPCLFPKCSGQMYQLTGQYQALRWFCDSCWFTLPDNFFVMEEPHRSKYLNNCVARYRKELIGKRRKEIEHALTVLREKNLVDDEPEIAPLFLLIASLR